MSNNAILGAIALAAIILANAGAAQATVYIGAQEAGYDSGNVTQEVLVTTVLSGVTSYQWGPSPYGTYSPVTVIGSYTSGEGGEDLSVDYVKASKTGSSTKPIVLYLTLSDISTGGNAQTIDFNFAPPSGLGKNWKITESEYVDPDNSYLTANGTKIGSVTYTTNSKGQVVGSDTPGEFTEAASFFNGPYSVTDVLVLTPTSVSGALDGASISSQISSVPEPSTWATMLLGFASLGLAGYHSKRKASTAVASARAR